MCRVEAGKSCLTLVDALAIADNLSTEIPEAARESKNREWTDAVYRSLKTCAENHKPAWSIHPEVKPYLGEYHCDFMLFEAGYGCRLACESEWETFRSTNVQVEWAFDKLRGVKADVKLLIFEGQDSWSSDILKYLEGYAQLDPVETFVFLRWKADHFERFWWKPAVAGVQTDPIKLLSF